MSLRVKAGIDLEELKKYGFKTGKEWADAGERCLEGTYHVGGSEMDIVTDTIYELTQAGILEVVPEESEGK